MIRGSHPDSREYSAFQDTAVVVNCSEVAVKIELYEYSHHTFFSSESCTGLYRGLGMTLVRDIPSHGVYFCMYDWVREQLEPGCRQRGTQSHTAAMIAGVTISGFRA